MKLAILFVFGQVEFPEARIYEETLNCLLYENRTGPDQELMLATSLRVPGQSYTSDDEDDRAARCGGAMGGVGMPAGAMGPDPASSASHSQRERSGLARLRSSKHS